MALEDHTMAEMYGWTIDEIDRLGLEGRQRVHYWWAVSTIHREASEYLREWTKAQEKSQQAFERMRAASAAKRAG